MSPIGIEIAVIVLAWLATVALTLWLWRDGLSTKRKGGAVIVCPALLTGAMVVVIVDDEA